MIELMKAVQYSEYGGPEVLRVVDIDEPHAGPGQVRIAVCSEGLFRLHVEQTFPLEQTAAAQEVSAKGHVTGKLVICVAQ